MGRPVSELFYRCDDSRLWIVLPWLPVWHLVLINDKYQNGHPLSWHHPSNKDAMHICMPCICSHQGVWCARSRDVFPMIGISISIFSVPLYTIATSSLGRAWPFLQCSFCKFIQVIFSLKENLAVQRQSTKSLVQTLCFVNYITTVCSLHFPLTNNGSDVFFQWTDLTAEKSAGWHSYFSSCFRSRHWGRIHLNISFCLTWSLSRGCDFLC